jgi:hypothetical protein
MTNYINKRGLLAFSAGGKDYIFNKGDTLALPEDDPHVRTLAGKGYIAEEKPSASNNETKGVQP